MKIARSTEHGRSENTICTAPAQDCEKSENPSDCLNFRYHRYDIYRYHRNRQVGVLNNSPLQPRGISVVSWTKENLSLLPAQPSSILLLIYSFFYHMWLLARWDFFSSLQNILCHLLMHYSVFWVNIRSKSKSPLEYRNRILTPLPYGPVPKKIRW